MENFQGILYEINPLSAFVRLALALIFGGVLGVERGRKNRPAGFRTYMVVCIGAAMVMITNQYIVQLYGEGDPTRMGAQVVSGIGFLGAGTIMVIGKNKVKGLTTAAGLWASACIGLTVGVGFYSGAFLGCIMIFSAMSLLHGFGGRVSHHENFISLYVELDKVEDVGVFLGYVKYHHFKVINLEILTSNEEKVVGLFDLEIKEKAEYIDVMEILKKVQCVRNIEVY